MGHADPGSVTEGNWGGFHLFEQQAAVAVPVGEPTDSLEGRRIMDELKYADTHPWPVGPDGSGFTLAKRDPTTGTARAENWNVELIDFYNPTNTWAYKVQVFGNYAYVAYKKGLRVINIQITGRENLLGIDVISKQKGFSG